MNKSRLIAAYVFVCFTFGVLFLRYGYLQLINHNILLQQSINNYSSIVSTIPVRGQILDKNGTILADNRASYVLAVLPKDVGYNSEDLFASLAKYVNITGLDKKKFLTQMHNSKNYDWVIIRDDLSDTEIANLTAHLYEFPGLSVFAHTKRYYPFNEIYSHSLGYVGRVSQKDKAKIKNQDYVLSDYIGKNGLEQYYESQLRGSLGKKSIKTDATGNEVGLIYNVSAVDGYTLRTTIDNELQKLAWRLLGEQKGAIVALDPQTGGVLAFVSKPGYDPNWFIDGISLDDWSELSNDEQKPLLNRAVQGTYPPGSTFKPFLALAALFLGVRTPDSTIYDPGYFVIPGSSHQFRDSYKYGRGKIDLMQAITFSSDTYFYKLGLDMGIDRADSVLQGFGFGRKTGIDLPIENSGLLPTRAWKAKRFATGAFARDPHQKAWLAADSVTFAIGQGFNNYTPLQMAFATSIIANEGLVIPPHFFQNFTYKNGVVVESYVLNSHQMNISQAPILEAQILESPIIQSPSLESPTSGVSIPKSQFKFIKQAMQNVILRGTARDISYGLKYTMAGKTGTAQVVAMNKNNRQAKFAGHQYRDHSWFIAFAPVDKPKIAIAIVVENGGFGAAEAAPIARKLFDFYLLGAQQLSNVAAGLSESEDTENKDDNIVEAEVRSVQIGY